MSQYSDSKSELKKVAEPIDGEYNNKFLLERSLAGIEVVEDKKRTLHVVPYSYTDNNIEESESDRVRVYMNTHQVEVDNLTIFGLEIKEVGSNFTAGINHNGLIMVLEEDDGEVTAIIQEK